MLLLSLPETMIGREASLRFWELQDRERRWADYSWMHLLSAFPSAQSLVCSCLIDTLHRETHPRAIAAYLAYLLSHSEAGQFQRLATVSCSALFIRSAGLDSLSKQQVALMLETRPFVATGLLESPRIYCLVATVLLSALLPPVHVHQVT